MAANLTNMSGTADAVTGASNALNLFLPIAGFLLVFIVVFAVLVKTKVLGDNKFVQLLVSFIVAIIFVSVASLRQLLVIVVPWAGVLIILLFLLLLITGFVGKTDFMNKWIGIVFVILFILIFVVALFFVFSNYVPFSASFGSDPNSSTDALLFSEWLFSGRVIGTIILIVVAVLVSWILVKIK